MKAKIDEPVVRMIWFNILEPRSQLSMPKRGQVFHELSSRFVYGPRRTLGVASAPARQQVESQRCWRRHY